MLNVACEPDTNGYCERSESGSEVREQAEVHGSAAIGILEYGLGTSELGDTFQRDRGLELVAFADADYASMATDKRSDSGGLVMCAGACL